MDNLVKTARELVLGLALLFAINTGAMASYYIPSESMAPNLLVGDHLVVSKFAYGYSNHSIVGAPDFFEGRVFERPVRRGDVAVFNMPKDGVRTAFIKRILGLPGDTIELREGVLVVNGAPVQRERIADFVHGTPLGERPIAQYRETLPDGRSYTTLDLREAAGDNVGPFTVPPAHYFALGDNRDNSGDSRWEAPYGLGFIPAENFVGRAETVLWSWAGLKNLFRLERTFSRIR